MHSRARFVTGAMFGIAVLAALLAGEAFVSARYHRATAERVLTDYAALSAEGVGNRLTAVLAGRLYPPLGLLGERTITTRAAIRAGLSGGARQTAPWITWAARIGTVDRLAPALRDAMAPLPPRSFVDTLRRASAALPDAAYLGTLVRGDELVVFSPLRRVPAIVYAVPLERIGEIAATLLRTDPLLPRALTSGGSLESGVSVRLLAGGRPLARRGPHIASRFRSIQPLGAMFPGLAIETGLAESLAPQLIIGGLPRSRLPLVLGILGLTLVLAAAGVLQLRQERRLARLREDFVAGASHELRTPLAQIRLFAETLRLGRIRSSTEEQHSLTVIEREARRLEHLVENLLHFSRTERGLLRVTPEPTDVARLTRDILLEYKPLAAKASAQLAVDAPADLVAAVDPSAWRQVLLNLLDNAVKYGKPGGTVTVALRGDATGIELAVSDQGAGIPPADRERSFDRFWRGEAARAAGIPGTGIGLATVRDLARLHGGSCGIGGAAGGGARCYVRLPRR